MLDYINVYCNVSLPDRICRYCKIYEEVWTMFFVLGCFVMNQKSQNEADIYYIIAIGISAASCAQPMPFDI